MFVVTMEWSQVFVQYSVRHTFSSPCVSKLSQGRMTAGLLPCVRWYLSSVPSLIVLCPATLATTSDQAELSFPTRSKAPAYFLANTSTRMAIEDDRETHEC